MENALDWWPIGGLTGGVWAGYGLGWAVWRWRGGWLYAALTAGWAHQRPVGQLGAVGRPAGRDRGQVGNERRVVQPLAHVRS